MAKTAKREAALNLRMRQELKGALEAEAAASNRSQSQVAVDWLEEARQGRAGFDAMLGGVQPAQAIKAMADLARQITKEGDPSLDPFARDALIAGWTAIIHRAVPFVPPAPLEMDVADKREDARTAIRAAFKAIKAAPDTGDTPPPTAKPGLFSGGLRQTLASAGLVSSLGHMSRADLTDALQECAYGAGLDHPNATRLIEPLSRFAAELDLPELTAAAEALSVYRDAQTDLLQERVAAYRRGQALAEVMDRRTSQAGEVAALAARPAEA